MSRKTSVPEQSVCEREDSVLAVTVAPDQSPTDHSDLLFRPSSPDYAACPHCYHKYCRTGQIAIVVQAPLQVSWGLAAAIQGTVCLSRCSMLAERLRRASSLHCRGHLPRYPWSRLSSKHLSWKRMCLSMSNLTASALEASADTADTVVDTDQIEGSRFERPHYQSKRRCMMPCWLSRCPSGVIRLAGRAGTIATRGNGDGKGAMSPQGRASAFVIRF